VSAITATTDAAGAAEKAAVRFDAEAHVIEIEFFYPIAAPDPAHALRQKIDEVMRIGDAAYRMATDTMEFGLDGEFRLRAVEIRANPARFETGMLPPAGEGAPVCLRLRSSFDHFGIAAIDAEPRFAWDAANAALAVTFAEAAPTDVWRRIAAAGAVRLGAQGALKELRFWGIRNAPSLG
jgi:hypothetical protein